MKENDYYGHYKAFVKTLTVAPDTSLQDYCMNHGVAWRRLYDWMRRQQISLKKLYATYREKPGLKIGEKPSKGHPDFREIKPTRREAPEAGHLQARGISVRFSLPSGVKVDMSECPSEVVVMIMKQFMGKEVSDVLS